MRSTLYNLIFGRNAMASGAMALTIVMLVALGCTCGKNFDFNSSGSNSSNSNTSSDSPFPSKSTSSGDVPSKPELQTMLKETADDFTDAIESEDFSTFYQKSSNDFQNTFTEQQVKDSFKTYTDKKQLFLPSLRKIQTTDATFSSDPHLRSESGASILVLEGSWPTKPRNIKFDAEYVLRDGEWKLLVWKLLIG